jgi:type II secretory pathway pseudopilin PulG
MTVLELMVVIAIIGALSYVAYGAVRSFTRADLVDDVTDIASLFRRISTVAQERGKLARVVFDFDKGVAVAEICDGSPRARRTRDGEKPRDAEAVKRDLADARQRLQDNAQMHAALASTPEDEMKIAAALAGHHVGDQACQPVTDAFSGNTKGTPLLVKLDAGDDIKLREIWVQHRHDSVTAGQVSVNFFPIGSAEKAVIEVTDGAVTYSVKLYGLSGQVEVLDGKVDDVDDFMMRNVEGDREADR